MGLNRRWLGVGTDCEPEIFYDAMVYMRNFVVMNIGVVGCIKSLKWDSSVIGR